MPASITVSSMISNSVRTQQSKSRPIKLTSPKAAKLTVKRTKSK